MNHFKEKYINPFTDYGFKRLFGEEPNKDLLIDFLNELLHKEIGEIKELTYLKNEQLGNTEFDRRAIFDLYCTNENGEKFIVELQKTKQKFFKDRTLYYSTFPIREQAITGSEWNFELKRVFAIAILDFIFDDDIEQTDKIRYDVKLTEIETCKVFYDKLTFIYLEMPKFRKKVDELETKFDKWLYVLSNLHKLDRIPAQLKEGIFQRLFDIAEIAKFDPQEYQRYEESLKSFRDLKNSFDTARQEGMESGLEAGRKLGIKEGRKLGIEEGRELGIEEGRILGIEEGKKEGSIESKKEIALIAIEKGLSIDIISELTGLSTQQIKDLI